MKLNELKAVLKDGGDKLMTMMVPGSGAVPAHFHVTEVGLVNKRFIDCGGTVRESSSYLLQIWVAHDVDHRLKASKLAKIIEMAGKHLGDNDHDVQLEYGEQAAATYDIAAHSIGHGDVTFFLTGKKTDCLAPDKCGVSACAPGSGCC